MRTPPRLGHHLSSRPWICSSCAAKRPFHPGRSLATRSTKYALPSKPARTRFAPSPTGFLHLGSLRTALYNFLLARSTGGQFILRIEDTDSRRTVPGAEAHICEDLSWAGLNWDEGPQVGGPHGPYRQSERTQLYRQHADQLLESGHAYRCFCTPERLKILASERNKLGLPTDYDRSCEGIPKPESDSRVDSNEPYVVRLRVPSQYPVFQDLVYGKVGNKHGGKSPTNPGQLSFEDPILLKSDGSPTYHLANVVDDHHMEISHVVRAAEWMSSTHKHLYMYEAFDWEPPKYAHVGLLLDQDHQKLSKRNLDTDVSSFKNSLEILPEALTNFVALLGWSHNLGKDAMTLEQLIQHFTLKFTKGNTVVGFEKMWFLQKAHARRRVEVGGQELEDLVDRVMMEISHRSQVESDPVRGDMNNSNSPEYIRSILRLDAMNYTTAKEFVARNSYLLQVDLPLEVENLKSGNQSNTEKALALFATAEFLNSIDSSSWSVKEIKERFHQIESIRLKEDDSISSEERLAHSREWREGFHHLLRWVITNGGPGPGIAEVMQVLGKEQTTIRLMKAMEVLRGS